MKKTSLVLACGALARELLALVEANGWEHIDVECLPVALHATPRKIAPAVDARLKELAGRYDHVFVAYADCGTTGALDRVLERHGAERLPGTHCFAVYAGLDEWDAMQADEAGTFYLTDFFVRHFESLVVEPLGLDRHPELRDAVFGNYRRVVYLSQTNDPGLLADARACARRLGLAFEHRRTGNGLLAPVVTRFAESARVA